MAEEHEKSEHEEHKSEEGGHKESGGNTFKKHKTLWIVGGVGAAGVLLLLFMNSSGGSSGSSGQSSQPSTLDASTVGAGGAVDTSSLIGSGGEPSWVNYGAAENLDYWPYVVPPKTTGSGGTKKTGGGSKHTGGGTKHTGGGTTHHGGTGGKGHGHKTTKVG